MGIQALLIDKSEIICKMLSHCLHHYLVKVSRFDSWEEGRAKFANLSPDIVFVDWEIQEGDRALAFSLKEDLPNSPVVPLFRLSEGSSSNSPTAESFPYKLKKPLNPQEVRDTVSALVPKLKEFSIHPFLKFPKTDGQNLQQEARPNKVLGGGGSKPVGVSPVSSPSVDASSVESTKTAQSSPHLVPDSGKISIPADIEKAVGEEFLTGKGETLSEKSFSSQNLSPNQEEEAQALEKSVVKNPSPLTGKQQAGSEMEKTSEGIVTSTDYSAELDKSSAAENPPFEQQKKPLPSSSAERKMKKAPPLESTISSEQEGESSYGIAIQKEDIDIDENTQNDLAPLPIKSSSSMRDRVGATQIELSEQDILRVINKYKDTLEFQNLMEEALKEHTSAVVQNILKAEESRDILQRSLKGFKETGEFKKLVEEQIKDFIKTSLPLVVKEIVEKEIKKIIGD